MLRFLALLASAGLVNGQVTLKPGSVMTYKNGETILTEYHYSETVAVEKGEGKKPIAKPFFYPISTPGGLKVTRDWPMNRGTVGETVDHFHQKSGWWCHGDVIPEGITLKTKNKHAVGVDFWTEDTGHGRIVSRAMSGMGGGTAFTHNLEWQSADGDTLLLETREIDVSITEGGTLILVTSKLDAKTAVTFGDTKEGSFGVRVHDDLRLNNPKAKSTVTSSDGSSVASPKKGTLPMWGQQAAWHDYSGEVNGKPCGIAIFTHPDNKPASCWHTRDYGLMAANPFGRDKSGFPAVKGKTDLVKLKAGETLTLKFAIYAHDGDVKTGKVAEAYAAFIKK